MEATTKTAPAPAPEPLSEDLGWLLSQASHALATELNAGLESLGIAPRGYCVLSTAKTGTYTQSELAAMIGLDKTTMVVLMDELEAAGLARRDPAPHDRRARVVTVTRAGERTAAEAARVVARIQADVLATLPAREREALVEGLARLVAGRLSTPVTCERPVRRRSTG